MNFIDPARHTRRAFLRRSTQLAAAGTALPFALNLAALGEAAAFEANDYKALVCVFLYGGCDYANTVVPYDSTRYGQDRKSTRLNSSHVRISYAVFCLKKKKQKRRHTTHPHHDNRAQIHNQVARRVHADSAGRPRNNYA